MAVFRSKRKAGGRPSASEKPLNKWTATKIIAHRSSKCVIPKTANEDTDSDSDSDSDSDEEWSDEDAESTVTPCCGQTYYPPFSIRQTRRCIHTVDTI